MQFRGFPAAEKLGKSGMGASGSSTPSQDSTVLQQPRKEAKLSQETYIELKQEISNLYLKIKRCSKDTTLTESQYIKTVETSDDREERNMISKLDPFVVLQYISSSIDVIINLKFEDIESKMIQKTQEKESNSGDTLGEQIKDLR